MKPLEEEELSSPFEGYVWVKNGRNLVFPDGTVEEGYSLVRKKVAASVKPLQEDRK